MRSLLPIALLLVGCSESNRVSTSDTGALPEPSQIEHSLSAFHGTLLGTNNGEWGGELLFATSAGDVDILVKDNVHGIVKNDTGIFAFTGLAHMSANSGHIYKISQADSGDIRASDLGELPGAPSNVHQLPDGSTTFLTASGGWSESNQQVYECYELDGDNVRSSNRCKPPQ